MPDFKDMLKFFRMREGLSQSELAKKIGLSPSTISMYEVGQREPDFETEEAIADFFNTDLNTLRGRDVERFKESSPKILQYYNQLNDKGRHVAIERVKELTEVPRYVQEDTTYVNAAHADDYAGAPEELKQLEEDIMDADDF